MRKLSIKYGITFLFISLFSSYNFATDTHKMHEESTVTTEKQSPATTDFMKAMTKMHKPMMDGIMDKDVDVAFVKGMMPHHQGAIDMAEIELKYSKNPKLRKLAEEIIANQKKEIKFMQEWLAEHDK